jgi:DNA polymerase-3 subunit gamma/tau
MASPNYQVIARKWRPQAFDEVIGQEHITRTLQNSLANGRVGHAFLFIGSRGIGKTTTARILAKALNCHEADGPTASPCGECNNCRTIAAGNNIDVIEIDGASNRGIDDAREIRENVRLAPSQSRYKVYIIDEVHQLTREAFNALLKTLEEPPPHAIFVLATTEAHKVPATIISRCQRFDFRRVSQEKVVELLKRILDTDGIRYNEDALFAIARAADGGVRDAESILDQLVSYCDGEIRFEDVFDVLGLVDWRVLHALCDAMLTHDIGKALHIVEDVVVHGKDLAQFVEEILRYNRNLLVCKAADAKDLLGLPDAEVAELEIRANQFKLTDIIRLVEAFAELMKGFDSQLSQRVALEALLVRLCRVSVEVSVDSVIEKLLALGAPAVGGAQIAPRTPPASAPAIQAPRAAEAFEPDPTDLAEPPPNSARQTPTPYSAALEVTDANLAQQWPILREAAGEESLHLAIWLTKALPVRVEDNTLVLSFEAEDDAMRRHLTQPDTQAILEKVLARATANLRRIRCELGAPRTAAPEGESAPEDQSQLPFAGSVTPEEARQALEDHTVAQIVDVFRGRVVAVQRRGGPLADAGDSSPDC